MFWLLDRRAEALAACVYLLLRPDGRFGLAGNECRAVGVGTFDVCTGISQSLQVFCSILALALCLEPGSVLNWGFVLKVAPEPFCCSRRTLRNRT
jgi:hypothetical protein